MFFKKRERVPPDWWLELDRRQRVWARRLADYLGRKVSGVPAGRMRVYVVAFLLVGLSVDVGITVSAVRKHAVPAARVEWPVQPVMREVVRPVRRVGLGRLLDSLRGDTVVGKELDSLLRMRPGLLDSLKRLEGMPGGD